MTRRPATVTQAELERAARVAKRYGVGIEVDRETGRFIILPEPVKPETGAKDASDVVADRLRAMGGQGG